MRFVNLTPHTIVLRPTDEHEIVVPPSGAVARVAAVWAAVRAAAQARFADLAAANARLRPRTPATTWDAVVALILLADEPADALDAAVACLRDLRAGSGR